MHLSNKCLQEFNVTSSSDSVGTAGEVLQEAAASLSATLGAGGKSVLAGRMERLILGGTGDIPFIPFHPMVSHLAKTQEKAQAFSSF